MITYLRNGVELFSDKKAEVDWSSPETLVIIILVVLLGLAFIFYILKLKGRLLP